MSYEMSDRIGFTASNLADVEVWQIGQEVVSDQKPDQHPVIKELLKIIRKFDLTLKQRVRARLENACSVRTRSESNSMSMYSRNRLSDKRWNVCFDPLPGSRLLCCRMPLQ